MPRLHPALWTLLRLRALGRLREMQRELRSVRGLVWLVFGVGLLALIMVPGDAPGLSGARLSTDQLDELFRSALLGLAVVGQIHLLGEKAVYFSPSEVDFLFPGPFSRTELLVYQVLASLGGLLVMSAAFAVLLAVLGAWWPLAFIGAFLSWLFLHLLAMCLATVRERLEAMARLWTGRFVVLSLVGLVAVGLMAATQADWTLRLLLWPFTPFAEVATARVLDLETLGWVLVCGVIDLGAVLALIRLDAGQRLAVEALSRRDLRRADVHLVQRWNPRGVMIGRPLAWFPALKGAGALVALQLTAALRGYPLLIGLGVIVLLIAGGFQFYQSQAGVGQTPELGQVLSLTIWTTLVVSNALRFDFRGEPRFLEYLKTLPIPAFALCAGQLVTPALITLIYQLPFLILAAPVLTPGAWWGALVLAVPIDLLWYGLENLGFLLYPASQFRRGFGDLQYLARQVFMLIAKVVGVALGVFLAVSLGWALVGVVTLSGAGVSIAVIGLALFIEVVFVVGVLALAFRRFDPSRLSS